MHCDIRHRAKQKKLSFRLNHKRFFKPFEMLHIDVWGIFSESTQEGYKYFLTIVDDDTLVTYRDVGLSSQTEEFSLFSLISLEWWKRNMMLI